MITLDAQLNHIDILLGSPGDPFLVVAGMNSFNVFKLASKKDEDAHYDKVGMFGAMKEAQAYVKAQGGF